MSPYVAGTNTLPLSIHIICRLPGYDLLQVQTLVLVMLVVAGLGYLVRECRHFWRSVPSAWLVLTSVLDIAIGVILATRGILMAAVSPLTIAAVILTVLIYLLAVDVAKVGIFGALGVR